MKGPNWRVFPTSFLALQISSSLVANCVWVCVWVGEWVVQTNLFLSSLIFFVRCPALELPRKAQASSPTWFIYRKLWWVFDEKNGHHPLRITTKDKGRLEKQIGRRRDMKQKMRKKASRVIHFESLIVFSLNSNNADIRFFYFLVRSFHVSSF